MKYNEPPRKFEFKDVNFYMCVCIYVRVCHMSVAPSLIT